MRHVICLLPSTLFPISLKPISDRWTRRDGKALTKKKKKKKDILSSRGEKKGEPDAGPVKSFKKKKKEKKKVWEKKFGSKRPPNQYWHR